MEYIWQRRNSLGRRDPDHGCRPATPSDVGNSAGSFFRSLAAWLQSCLRPSTLNPARLAVIERIALSPKHSLVLIKADGVHLLVATSADGAPAFFSLHRTEETGTRLVDPGDSPASDPQKPFREEESAALLQTAPRGTRRAQRPEQATGRLRFEGRISW